MWLSQNSWQLTLLEGKQHFISPAWHSYVCHAYTKPEHVHIGLLACLWMNQFKYSTYANRHFKPLLQQHGGFHGDCKLAALEIVIWLHVAQEKKFALWWVFLETLLSAATSDRDASMPQKTTKRKQPQNSCIPQQHISMTMSRQCMTEEGTLNGHAESGGL